MVSVAAWLALASPAAFSQGNAPAGGAARLFLSFAEDAALVETQWWEGQGEFVDGAEIDAGLLRGVVAFRPWGHVEIGGRVGFGSTDAPPALPDGSGATDLDAWIKYRFGDGGGATEFGLGGIVTVPTGDDTAGLGYDAFSVGGFGALRHRFDSFTLVARLGLRANGDGSISGLADLDGEVSPSLGAGILVDASDRVGFVGEAVWEGERFDGTDDDARALAGINWRVGNRGTFRGAIAFGLTDGAPDAQLIAGYAYAF
jgi:hypothetical protein